MIYLCIYLCIVFSSLFWNCLNKQNILAFFFLKMLTIMIVIVYQCQLSFRLNYSSVTHKHQSEGFEKQLTHKHTNLHILKVNNVNNIFFILMWRQRIKQRSNSSCWTISPSCQIHPFKTVTVSKLSYISTLNIWLNM